MVNTFYGGEGFFKAIDKALEEELKTFNMVDLKSDENTFRIHPEDESKYNTNLDAFKEYNQSIESYIQLMNTFLNRKDKRKLSRRKGFKTFTDRIYGR